MWNVDFTTGKMFLYFLSNSSPLALADPVEGLRMGRQKRGPLRPISSNFIQFSAQMWPNDKAVYRPNLVFEQIMQLETFEELFLAGSCMLPTNSMYFIYQKKS